MDEPVAKLMIRLVPHRKIHPGLFVHDVPVALFDPVNLSFISCDHAPDIATMPQKDQSRKGCSCANNGNMGISKANIDQCSYGRYNAGKRHNLRNSQDHEEYTQRQKKHKGRMTTHDPLGKQIAI